MKRFERVVTKAFVILATVACVAELIAYVLYMHEGNTEMSLVTLVWVVLFYLIYWRNLASLEYELRERDEEPEKAAQVDEEPPGASRTLNPGSPAE